MPHLKTRILAPIHRYPSHDPIPTIQGIEIIVVIFAEGTLRLSAPSITQRKPDQPDTGIG